MIVCPAVPVAVPAMFSQKPVRVSGPFAGPAYEVDYGAVAADVAKTKVGDRIKDLLRR